MSARNWLCTKHIENKDSWEDYLKEMHTKCKATYTVGQLEQAPTTNTYHIQFFMNFKQKARISAITKHDKQVHAEKVLVNNGADRYCMKIETRVAGPIELGEKPIRRNNKTDWEDVWNKAKKGDIDNIPANIRIVHYNKLKAIQKDYMKFQDKDHLRGIWVYGKAGAGKSRWVREQCKESLYPKLCNKWWDGYQGEKYVVMDDIMPQHSVLAQQLKIWSDRYDCILETKGGAVHSQYEYFIITSQYSIDEIFQDEKDREALHRRFHEFKIKDILNLGLTLSQCPAAPYNTQVAAEQGPEDDIVPSLRSNKDKVTISRPPLNSS